MQRIAYTVAARYLANAPQMRRWTMNSIEESVKDRGTSTDAVPGAVHSLTGQAGALLLFAVAYYIAWRYGMSFSTAMPSPFWFPDSVLLCALLIAGPRQRLMCILIALLIRLFSEVSATTASWYLIATFAVDVAKAWTAALLIRRFTSDPLRLDTVRQFALFCLFAVLIIPAASAFAGAALGRLNGSAIGYWTLWDRWLMGDALTQLVITPAIFYWVLGAHARLSLPPLRRGIEVAALTVGLVLTTYMAANTGEGFSVAFLQTRLYAPIPFLFWAALRFGMAGASGAVMVLAIVTVHAALRGQGPFASLEPDLTAMSLQNFLLLRAAPLYLMAIVVEQRRRTERSLRASQEHFRLLANSAPMLMWASGRDRLCEFVNASWLQMTGRTIEQELGAGWTSALHPEDQQRSVETYHAAFDARVRYEVEYRVRRHDGEYRWLFVTGMPRYAANGEFLGYIGSAVDISDRKRAEDATRALAHAQRLAVMGELTALIAHEVRQPLSAILLSAEAAHNLLRRDDPPVDELLHIMSEIRKYDLRAEDTISKIRAFVRNQETERRPLDLNALIADVLKLLASDAERRRVRLGCMPAADLPHVLGDATQLQQVLVNLAVNAMDAQLATPEERRELIVTTRLHDQTHVEVAICDRGCGIAPEKLPLLFDSFFTTGPKGMGLGLSIVRSIVAAHRGRVWARNNDEGGATFIFTVPIADRTSADTRIAAGR